MRPDSLQEPEGPSLLAIDVAGEHLQWDHGPLLLPKLPGLPDFVSSCGQLVAVRQLGRHGQLRRATRLLDAVPEFKRPPQALEAQASRQPGGTCADPGG